MALVSTQVDTADSRWTAIEVDSPAASAPGRHMTHFQGSASQVLSFRPVGPTDLVRPVSTFKVPLREPPLSLVIFKTRSTLQNNKRKSTSSF